MNRWFSTTRAAVYCDCHVETIRKEAREGRLPCVRRGPRGHFRFLAADLDAWLGQRGRPQGEAPNE